MVHRKQQVFEMPRFAHKFPATDKTSKAIGRSEEASDAQKSILPACELRQRSWLKSQVAKATADSAYMAASPHIPARPEAEMTEI